MNKMAKFGGMSSVKGLALIGGAALILTGGAGSLAYWNSTQSDAGGTVNAGTIQLGTQTCGAWKDQHNVDFDIATDKVVPGDVLTKQCTSTIAASGTNLHASLGITGFTRTGGTLPVTPAATYDVDGGGQVTTLSAADNGKTLTTNITLNIDNGPGGTLDNASKLQSAILSNYTVTATQTTP